MTPVPKEKLKRLLLECLAEAEEVQKIILFGSFLQSESPNDMDVAVFVNGEEAYLPLALKFRKLCRPLASQIPLDIIPMRSDANGVMFDEILKGELLYER